MSRNLDVVRCPWCGSTVAEAIDGAHELTAMRCAACGHEDLCDEHQVRDVWSVRVELPDGEVMPTELPPLLARPCPTCERAPAFFWVRPAGARDEAYEELARLKDIRRCRACETCYSFVLDPGGMVSEDEDSVARLDPATSRVLLALSSGRLTSPSLAAYAAVAGFRWWRVAEAVTPAVDFAPIFAVLHAELSAGREVHWPLVSAAARAGADVASFLAPLIPRLGAAATATDERRNDRAGELTAVLEACLARGLEITAALPAACAVLAAFPWLRCVRPRLAPLCTG